MLKFENVSKVYNNGFQAVKSVNLEILKGEFVVLIGPSGSGKTTTMKMINRLAPHTSGTIFVDGKDIRSLNLVELRRNIGYVIQQAGLFPHYTIEKNIAVVPKLKGWNASKVKQRVHELLKLVGLDPEVYANRYPKQLSGGQQQRVGVARALAADPDIILMDEPFGALDPITREQLQAELIKLQRKLKKTIVFVTHDMDEALKLGDRIAIMKDGELLQFDTPEKLLHEPAHGFVEEFIGKHRMIQNPELMPITDVLTDKTYTSHPERSPERALAYMRKHKINSLVIVDENEAFIGMISAYDLIAKIGKVSTIEEIVLSDHVYLREDATAKDAIATMPEASLGIIPVLDSEDKVLGLVTRGTLLTALSSQWVETEEKA
ncbi:betaine/proline/choline family ABC transporter ATP-binding protein [Paenibacillus yanchengensis]|uniref:Quaternary amine transport ATP-binding protein n=1 Tax=Paenibacillus yanchengensis TaxID=2035833 RepID=A0ABW4YQT0_9BACL